MFDRFRAFTQTQQILLIAGMLAASCVLLTAVWFFFLRTPYQPLFTNLRTSDAATIVSDLEKRKIPYRLSEEGTTIAVPANQVETTRLKVMTEDLPLKGTVGFELFNKSDMGLTDFAQKINYLRALQGELERTIMSLDGVVSARVHVSLAEDRLFQENQVAPKASATIRMAKGANLDSGAVLGIQRLIAAAIPKLDSSDVVVLDEEGRVISSASRPKASVDTLSPAAEQRLAVEEYYAARIRQALLPSYPGLTVAVEAVAGPDGIAGWSAGARAFPLHVQLSSGEVIGEAQQEALRGVVAAAVGVGAAGGDTVAFAVEAATEVASTETAPAGRSRAAPSPWRTSVEEKGNSWGAQLVYVLVPVCLIVGIVVLLRTARRPRRLSEEQRSEFVDKLQRALAQREGHAAS